ncbi:IGSF1 protein, partial [Nothocercus nigrocapillus]|nr:IGSF1 protein [Nothocercus nigrocapillus]
TTHVCLSTPVPRPSLSLYPGKEVALGDTVTLRCSVPQLGVWVVVFKEGDGKYQWHWDKVEGTAEVSMRVSTRGFAGRYRCGYEIPALSWYSELSNPVELVVLDPSYPPPTMSLTPSRCVRTGANVTIQCHSMYGATFILHKASSSVPVQRQRLHKGDTATFIIPRVTQA